MDKDSIKRELEDGLCTLGIEFGSTRVKAVLINSEYDLIASGNYDWNNRREGGVWTYSIDDIKTALKSCYKALKDEVFKEYAHTLKKIKAMGISAMMHGYMAFDNAGNLLTPFRTWRNTITEKEADELTSLFDYPIPQRWTISHFLKDIRQNCEYLPKLSHISTLASYVHRLLTGEKVIGIGDASGMFPLDTQKKCYLETAVKSFKDKYSYSIPDLFPKILLAGEKAGFLTEEGLLVLDPDGDLEIGIPLCPPEGDAGTGMVATKSVKINTGNVSAGTSAFLMVVLEKALSKVYKELDLVTTPDGNLVAMAHTNNCTGDYDEYLSLFSQVIKNMGYEVNKKELYDKMLNLSLEKDADLNNVLFYNFVAGEPITGLNEGFPFFIRTQNEPLALNSFMKGLLYSAIISLRYGFDLLYYKEGVKVEAINGHGGYFKTYKVGQTLMANALKTPISVLKTAGEGGAWGIALLAEYLFHTDMALDVFLDYRVFSHSENITINPTEKEMELFDEYYQRHKTGLDIQKAAVSVFKE